MAAELTGFDIERLARMESDMKELLDALKESVPRPLPASR
jgi:hypothetical protein